MNILSKFKQWLFGTKTRSIHHVKPISPLLIPVEAIVVQCEYCMRIAVGDTREEVAEIFKLLECEERVKRIVSTQRLALEGGENNGWTN